MFCFLSSTEKTGGRDKKESSRRYPQKKKEYREREKTSQKEHNSPFFPSPDSPNYHHHHDHHHRHHIPKFGFCFPPIILPRPSISIHHRQTLKRARHARCDRKNLVLRSTTLRELKPNTTTRKSPVHLSIGIKTVVDTTTLLLIKHNPQQLGSIFLCAGALADDFDRVDDVR